MILKRANAWIEKWIAFVTPTCLLLGVLFPEIAGRGVVSHPSLITDLRICFATVKILFTPESTEGNSEGQTTAMSVEADGDAALESSEILRM